VALGATTQPLDPQALHLEAEGPQGFEIAANPKVRIVPADLATELLVLLAYRQMPMLSAPLTDTSQRRTQTVSGCLRFASHGRPHPRKTRFRLVANLYRVGLVTHWVPHAISRTISDRAIPSDQAFLAHINPSPFSVPFHVPFFPFSPFISRRTSSNVRS
jgi:hypothetical protein